MKILLKVLILSGLASQAQGQMSWVPQADDQLKVKIGAAIPKYNFQVSTPTGEGDDTAYFEPNAPGKAFINFSYRNLGITLSSVDTNSAGDTANKGSSSGVDFQFRFYGKRSYEFLYQSYKGYFLENSSALDPAYGNSSQKVLYPDLETKNYGINFNWNLDDEAFSQAVAFDQNGYQEVSDWGKSWFAHLSQSKIHNPSGSFIPTSAASRFGSLSTLNDVSRTMLAGGFAAGGIAVYKRFYISGMLSLGLGYQNAELRNFNGDSETKDDLGTYSSLKAGLGYNGLRHVVGVQVLGETVGTKVNDGEVSGSLYEYSLFYAYRFDSVSMPPLDWVSSLLDAKP